MYSRHNRPIRLPACLALRLGEEQRRILEQLSVDKKISIGEAARELLEEGLRARGLA